MPPRVRARKQQLRCVILQLVSSPNSLSILDLSAHYRRRELTPAQVLERCFAAADATRAHNVWVTQLNREAVMRYALALESRSPDSLPLYGIPFVIKDNIDLAGVPTTAGCPAFSYLPKRSATVVQRLIDAGAIPLGKTNLDQFATGLVGTRSPSGACANSFDIRYIAGGSSSGSAVAVAAGIASFSLGTDTAGSGRVPACFNNIVGLKPSLGRLSATGVVPACRSLDTISIFSLTADDALSVLEIAEGFDRDDAYSRPLENQRIGLRSGNALRFGVPRPEQLQFFGDAEYARCFEQAVQTLTRLGAVQVVIDFAPFLEAARLLYEGPWVAERYAAVGAFIDSHPDEVFPVTRQIIGGGKGPSAAAAFAAQYRLMDLKRAAQPTWDAVDFIVTPTAATIYTIDAVNADPVRLNSNLGFYTNYMNLFDLAGVAVPTGFRSDGMPFGVTLVGPHSTDRDLLALASRLQRASVQTVGSKQTPMPEAAAEPEPVAQDCLAIAVCGAHMTGLPLNHQLTERGAYLLRSTRSAPAYRLYALPGGPPQRPGMIRVAADGVSIELEVWAVPLHAVGGFISSIPSPLGIGRIDLITGDSVAGFLCESYAIQASGDISAYGGWRSFLERETR
jgi:allophanate hydrolase